MQEKERLCGKGAGKEMRMKLSPTSTSMMPTVSLSILAVFFVFFLTVLPAFTLAAQPFNVDIDLPATYQDVAPGSQIWFTIKLLNLANSQRMDVILNYEIVDSGNNSLVYNSKTVAIETQASFVADLMLPASAPAGNYFLRVTVRSTLGESIAQSSFKVSKHERQLWPYYAAGGIVLILLGILLAFKSKPLIEKIRLRRKIRKIVKSKL